MGTETPRGVERGNFRALRDSPKIGDHWGSTQGKTGKNKGAREKHGTWEKYHKKKNQKKKSKKIKKKKEYREYTSGDSLTLFPRGG